MMLRFLHRFAMSRAAGVATTFAFAFPVIAGVGAGAVDLAGVHNSKTKLQAAVDAAAIEGAKQLSMANASGLQARAEQFIGFELGDDAKQFTYKITTSVGGENNSEFTVTAKANRLSFFGNLLPPGGWNFGASSTAQRLNQTPLCVLVSGGAKADELMMKDQSDIVATGCMVHGNSDLTVQNNARLTAGAVEVAGLSVGAVSPVAQTGAMEVEDPFAGMKLNIPGALCTPLDLVVNLGVQIMTPGVHCGAITVGKSSTLYLLPGEHYFRKGTLTMSENSKIVGTDVAMVFDETSEFLFKDAASVELEGRKNGVLAGFVIATTRNNVSTFEISSDAARKLLGTIYIPSATLRISGGNAQVADRSAWTVIVAKSVKMEGSPSLVINANYAGSSVPVPKGVGPGESAVRLTH